MAQKLLRMKELLHPKLHFHTFIRINYSWTLVYMTPSFRLSKKPGWLQTMPKDLCSSCLHWASHLRSPSLQIADLQALRFQPQMDVAVDPSLHLVHRDEKQIVGLLRLQQIENDPRFWVIPAHPKMGGSQNEKVQGPLKSPKTWFSHSRKGSSKIEF